MVWANHCKGFTHSEPSRTESMLRVLWLKDSDELGRLLTIPALGMEFGTWETQPLWAFIGYPLAFGGTSSLSQLSFLDRVRDQPSC